MNFLDVPFQYQKQGTKECSRWNVWIPLEHDIYPLIYLHSNRSSFSLTQICSLWVRRICWWKVSRIEKRSCRQWCSSENNAFSSWLRLHNSCISDYYQLEGFIDKSKWILSNTEYVLAWCSNNINNVYLARFAILLFWFCQCWKCIRWFNSVLSETFYVNKYTGPLHGHN